MQENNLKGLWIPYEILTSQKLSDKEKYIYSLILYYSKNDGFCTISNKYNIVEVQSKGGKISMDTIKNFLDVNVLFDMNSLLDNVVEETNDAIKQEENLASGKVIMNGVWYDSIDDYINGTPSANQGT